MNLERNPFVYEIQRDLVEFDEEFREISVGLIRDLNFKFYSLSNSYGGN